MIHSLFVTTNTQGVYRNTFKMTEITEKVKALIFGGILTQCL